MKTKYLFYSLAMAGMFAACSQEELVDAPVQETNALTSRTVVGNVTFVGDEIESRYNSEAGSFTKGDQMGIYLMDSFNKDGEKDDANETYKDYQSAWWDMYTMVDYISSNYGYVYEGGDKWVNRASQLVEGNYIAMFPQNTRATNRRDLWHPIDANVDLVAHSSIKRYYVNRENQFFVGYEQIKRDQESEDANGQLTAKISMKPILTYGKMWFINDAAKPYRLKKVVFKHKDNVQLPNVAYVRPATKDFVVTESEAKTALGKTWSYATTNKRIPTPVLQAPVWAWNNLASMEKYKEVSCNVVAQGVYDRSKYTQADARNMVVYENTNETGKVPYGMTEEEAAPVYEYVFNFPAGGVELAGNNESNYELTYAGISIALPTIDGWQNLEVEVHVDKFVVNQGWVAGIISNKEHQSGEFNLEDLALWDGDKMSALPEVSFSIDDDYFTKVEQIEVSTSKDFFDLVKGRLSNNDTSIPVVLKVVPTGTGLVIGKDVVDLIDAYKAKYGADKVAIEFIEGSKVVLAAANSIHKFAYSNSNVELDANQDVEGDLNGIATLTNKAVLTVKKGNLDATVVNEGTMIVTRTVINNMVYNGVVKQIDNNGDLTLNNGAGVTTLNNKPLAKTVVDGANVTVVTLNNEIDHTCSNGCQPAEMEVKAGKLNVTKFTNEAKLTNNGEINVATELKHTADPKNHGYALINNGTISGNGTISNGGIIDNYGKMIAAKLLNTGDVKVYGGKITGFDNEEGGEMYVYSESAEVQSVTNSNGAIIFVGVAPQEIGTKGQDNRIYQTTKSMLASELAEVQTLTGFRNIWVYNDITYNVDADGNHIWKQSQRELIENVVVKNQNNKDIYFRGETTGLKFWMVNAALTIENTMTLHVNNALNVKVKKYSGVVDCGTNSKLDGEKDYIDHNQITIEGSTEFASALSAVNAGGVIRLNADLAVDYWSDLNSNDKMYVLDLNGHELNVVNGNGSIYAGPYVPGITIKNGVISNQVRIKNSSNRFENVEFTFDDVNNNQNPSVFIDNGAKAEFVGCTFSAKYSKQINNNYNQNFELSLVGCRFKTNNSETNPTIELGDGKVEVKNCVFEKAFGCEIVGKENMYVIEGNTFMVTFGFAEGYNGVENLTEASKNFLNNVLDKNTFKGENKIAAGWPVDEYINTKF